MTFDDLDKFPNMFEHRSLCGITDVECYLPHEDTLAVLTFNNPENPSEEIQERVCGISRDANGVVYVELVGNRCVTYSANQQFVLTTYPDSLPE